jgi:hypothetical protein
MVRYNIQELNILTRLTTMLHMKSYINKYIDNISYIPSI